MQKSNLPLSVVSFPLGTLKPRHPGSPVDPGCLLCDGITSHSVTDYPELCSEYRATSKILTFSKNQTQFILTAQIDPSTGSHYQIVAQGLNYIIPTSSANMIQGSGTATDRIKLDISPLNSTGIQTSSTGTRIEDIIPMLYAGKPLQAISAKSWHIEKDMLIGDVSDTAAQNTKYILRVYKPEVIAYYRETQTPLDVVNVSTASPITSAALINYLTNTSNLTLGSATPGAAIKLFGEVCPQPGCTFTELTVSGKISIKSSTKDSLSLVIDNEAGTISVPTTPPREPGHLVNKLFVDQHTLHTQVAIGGHFSNGRFINTSLHGIAMGVGGLFDADMVDERHVGGWGWTADTQASEENYLPIARNEHIPTITSQGCIDLGKAIHLFVEREDARPKHSAISLIANGTKANPWLQITNPNNALQALQLGNVNTGIVNIISVKGTLHITNNAVPTLTSPTYAAIEASSFNLVSTITAKKEVKTFTQSGLDIINNTEIVQYSLKSEDRKRVGFIAERTNKLLSGAEQNQNDIGTTLGVALKAIQELSAENIELKKRLQKLESKIF